MYNNQLCTTLLKRGYTFVNEGEKRVIDTNELAERRIQENADRQKRAAEEGFVAGISAPTVELDPLFADGEDEETLENKVQQLREEAAGIRENASKEAEEILAQAREQAMQLEKDARARAEQERMQMLEDARSQGYQEGLEQAAREAEAGRRELQEYHRQLEAEYQQYMDEMEPQFVDTITDIYEHLFHVELDAYKDILVHLIANTMRKVEGNHDFLIHVSKEDYPGVSMQKKEIMAGATTPNSTVEVIEDMTLGKNDCFIETEGGIFDCGLGTQLMELKQTLRLLSYEKKQ